MKLKLLLVTVCLAGFGASYAFADGGNDGDHGHKNAKCQRVHVRGTIAAQTLTVAVDHGSSRLNLAPGSQVVLQLGGTGQTVRVNAEACATTTGSTTQLLVKSAELQARNVETPMVTTAPSTSTP
jgi:hypothetical protein